MRKVWSIAIALAAALAVLAACALPAGAAVVGGGEVVGNVDITNKPACIPVATASPAPVTYSFSDVVLTGTFTDGSNVFVGPIDVSNVHGASLPAGDNTVMGNGVVNSSLDRATFKGSSVQGGTIEGNFYGTYQRVGSIVLVHLNVSAKINNSGSLETPITVAAQFSPTQGDGLVQPVCSASFSGLFLTA